MEMNYREMIQFIELYTPAIIFIGISLALGIFLNYLIYRFLEKISKYKQKNIPYAFFIQMKGPLYLVFPLIFINIATYFLDLSLVSQIIELTVKILLIVFITWSIIKLINYSDTWVGTKYKEDFNRVAAKFYLLKKLFIMGVIFLAVSLFLMSFDRVKEIGQGLLLSAGVISGIILFAAQGIFGNIISGFQLAFSRPISIGDELFIDDQFGSVEEITLTNVIFRTWDLRRMIIPIKYLMEKPYENWTYPTPNLIGIVFLYVDYSIRIDELREILNLFLENNPLWDKKTAKIEVTDATEKSIQLRILVSGRNPTEVWNLRCQTREQLIKFIQQQYPQSLPKLHADVSMQTHLNGSNHRHHIHP